MADNIKLITYAGSSVTPQHDAVMANLELPGNGIIYGCDVTIKNATTLHIASGMGVIYGREFEIMDSDITVQLSTTGTLLGQLYVHMDLSNTAEPIQLLVQTGVSLDDLVDDPEVNITAGISEMQLATFTIDTSTLDNLQETFTVIENLTGDIEEINSNLTELENAPNSFVRAYTGNSAASRSFNISFNPTNADIIRWSDKEIFSFEASGQYMTVTKNDDFDYTVTFLFASVNTSSTKYVLMVYRN